MLILPYLEHEPRIARRIAAHESAVIIGRAELQDGCTFGELTLLRGDGEAIRIGTDCWFGEASTVHIAHGIFPAIVGSHVTVGRYALVHACAVADDCVVGEQAAVMDGSVVGPGSVIAARSVVPPRKTLEGGWLYMGAPARAVQRISSELRESLHQGIRTGATGSVPHVSADTQLMKLRQAPGTGVNRAFWSGVYVAPTASISGDVVLGPRASIWFGAEIDAGPAHIDIGEETSIQDNSRLYARRPGHDIRIGPRVIIGHNARLFSCVVEERAIIGMGSIIGEGTVVRAGACVAAGSITEPGTEVTAGQIWSGRPARAARALTERNRLAFAQSVDIYVQYAANYLLGKTRAVTPTAEPVVGQSI
jgi:gamma-carbonic anhydrase